MTEILCRWLNGDLKLSQKVDTQTFAEAFASGYLIGEVLQKYELQDDFEYFSKSRTADSKLNNFTRLEPTFRTLEVPFNSIIAHEVMNEKAGVATRLLYQLYISLSNKEDANLTGVALDTMRARAPVKLESMERGPYRERLKILTPRQTDLNLDELVDKFRERKKQHLDVEFRTKYEQEEKVRQWQQDERQRELEKAALGRQKQTELVARIRAATVEIPKTPPNKTLKAIAIRKEVMKKKEAEQTKLEIEKFEQQLSKALPGGMDSEEDKAADEEVAALLVKAEKSQKEQANLIKPASNDEYINKIRKRLQEDGVARKEREKRRRKILVDQLQAHEEQEDARREELLVNCLMRQSQQERRIATQLLQLRHEKAIIRENRIFREKQYEERRQKDFQEALDMEAELARLAKIEYMEQIKRDKELHDKIAQDRAEDKYRKHFNLCKEILLDIVDFSCKIGKYRELTGNLLPPKLMREWTLLFTEGKPLYEKPAEPEPDIDVEEDIPIDSVLEEEKQKLLDEGDFLEYKNMVGEWDPPEDCEVKGPAKNNAVLGHILARLFSIVAPPSPPPEPPEMPPFPVKACFLGKSFAGKSSAAYKMAELHGLAVLNVDDLVKEAVDACKAGEVLEQPLILQGDETGPGGAPNGDHAVSTSLSTPNVVQTPATLAVSEGQKEVPKTPATPKTSYSSKKGKADSEAGGKEGDVEGDLVNGDTTSKTKLKGDLTPRAKLGHKVSKLMRKGLPIKDELLVEIMIESVKRVKEERGWIMDGFPCTIIQAKLLEKALSGYDANAKPSKLKLKQSRLAPDPNPPKDPPPPVSGIDMVILLDVPDEMALRRAAGRTFASQSGEEYHQEFKPPPEGSTTGVGKVEKVLPVKDDAHDQEQIQHRLTGFQDAWKKLDKWFNGFGILFKVNADQKDGDLFTSVETMMKEAKEKIEKAKEDAAKQEELSKAGTEGGVTDVTSQPTDGMDSGAPQASDVQQPSVSDSKTVSPKGSRAGSAKRTGSGKQKSPKREKSPKSKDRDKSPKSKEREKSSKKRTPSAGSREGSPKRSAGGSGKDKGRKGSKSGSPKRKSRSKSPKKRTPTPEPEPEPEPEPQVPLGPPPPQPGDEDWVWVDEKIDEALAYALAPLWENTEQTYIATGKHTFKDIREEREQIYHYFFNIRKEFKEYLRRPDSKKEFVQAFQQEYNEVAEDMRDDDETKAELHQRVQDLKEQLWEISDNRKIEAEEERQSVIDEGWLEDRLGLLTNHYLTLMQCEVDRYQHTLRLIKDYYQGMEGKIPEEYDPLFVRVPLIDLQSASRSASVANISAVPSESVTRAVTPNTPSAKGKKSKEPPPEPEMGEIEKKPIIPLVPRRPTSAEGFFPSPTPAGDKPAGKGSKSRAGKKEKEKLAPSASVEETQESPLPPMDPDEKLISDAFLYGITKISELSDVYQKALMTAAELAAKEAEESEKEREGEKGKGGKGKEAGKKRSKSKSPSGKKSPGRKSPSGKKSPVGKKSPKKGKKAATPTPPPTPPPIVNLSPEEQALHDRVKKEYLAAMSHEELGLKTRMELIKVHAIQVLQDLKAKAEVAYKDMDDWLGSRFQTEMKSIDDLCNVYGEAIEKREKVQSEFIMIQDEFVINEKVKVFRTPSPPPRPSPVELALADIFTVEQTQRLLKQFFECAPSGFISSKGFADTLSDLAALTHGTEALPDSWLSLNPAQMEQISSAIAPDSEYIDWRAFLLQTTKPWPQPTQQELIQTLDRFKVIDKNNTGMVTEDEFVRVSLWFTPEERPPSPEDLDEPYPFDRIIHIFQMFFRIFADFSQDPAKIDYTNFLMYFCSDEDAVNGFFRALSVASHTHMPRLKVIEPEVSPEDAEVMEEVIEKMKGEEIHTSVKMIETYLGTTEEGIPPGATKALVPIEALVKVLHHGQPSLGDSHRFSVTSDPEDTFSFERLAGVYRELGDDSLRPVAFYTLFSHPIIQDCLSLCTSFRSPDFGTVFSIPVPPPVENDSQSVMS